MSTPQSAAPRRSRRRVLLLVVVALLVLWGVAVAVSTASAYRDLQAARAALFAAQDSLTGMELSDARALLASGSDEAASAAGSLGAPHLAPLRVVPVVGANLSAVTTLAEAVRDTADAGTELLGGIGEIAGDGGTDGAGLPLEGFARLAPLARELAETVQRTQTEVEATGSRWLLPQVADARRSYLEVIGPRVASIDLAADAAEVLPSFLGHEGPRRYLVGAGSLSELRGAGGLLGSWTVLTVDDGRLEFGDFADVEELGEPPEDVAAPSEEFAARYREYGSLRYWRNANFTPHFPSAAQVWLGLWEADGRRPLDGVIMVDAVTFARLVEHSGPIEVAGITTLRPGETVQFVGLDAYAAFEDSGQRKEVLGAVATVAFRRVLDALSEGDVATTMQMLADLTEGGHLRVYSQDDRVQDVLRRAGLAGSLPDVDGEFAAVFVSNLAANKVDYFTQRRIEHRVRLLPDGVTRGAIDVLFHNQAPTEGYPRHVLGPWVDGVTPGDNLSEVTFLCGYDCEVAPLPAGMRSGGTVLGRPAVDVRLRVPAGERRRVEYRTRTPDGWTAEGGELLLTVHHTVQPTLHDSELRVVVEIPSGFRHVEMPPSAQVSGNEIVWEARVSGDVQLDYRLVPEEEDAS